MAQLFQNNFSDVLSAALSATGTSLKLTRTDLMAVPSGDYILLTLETSARDAWEIVKVTSHTAGSQSCTVQRAQEGTTARAWAAGDKVEARFTAGSVQAMSAKDYVDTHISATNVHSATSAATASRLVIRDANGRSQVATPSAAADIATKGYVDSTVTSGPAGADGYTVFLTNSAHVFPAGTDSATAGNTGAINVIVFKGGSQIAATIGTITGQVTGLTTSVANNNSTSANFTVTATTALTTRSGVLTIPITADGKSFTAKFSWSLGLTGAAGPQGNTGPQGERGPEGPAGLVGTYASKIFAWKGAVTVSGGGSRTGVVLSRIYNNGTQENYALLDSGSYIVGNG
jgi:hypothetical protein